MKYLSAIFFLLLSLTAVDAQEQKLAWFEDLAEAKTYAIDNQTDILMVFAGSDWCKPCIQFKKDILESDSFQVWGKTNIAILYLDFPARKKNELTPSQTAHNEALAERFNKSGAFPNIFLIDSSEKVLANPAFKNQEVSTFIASFENNLSVKK